MGVTSASETAQLRPVGLPAMTVQIRTFELAEDGGLDASLSAAK